MPDLPFKMHSYGEARGLLWPASDVRTATNRTARLAAARVASSLTMRPGLLFRVLVSLAVTLVLCACGPSEKQASLTPKLVGTWKAAEGFAFQDEYVDGVLVLYADSRYESRFKVVDRDGEVSNTWEKGTWTITPGGTLRLQTTESNEGTPKTHEAGTDLAVHAISDSELQLKTLLPNVRSIRFVRVAEGTRP